MPDLSGSAMDLPWDAHVRFRPSLSVAPMYCIVYNATHEPLSVIPLRRGLRLLLLGKAVVLEELPGKWFKTADTEYPMPASVVLKEYRKTGSKYYGSAQLNQRNLFVRDQYTCGYCQRHDADLSRGEYLTRDHVFPQTLGGKDEWTNVVTSCSTCNHRKDDHEVIEFAKMLDEERSSEQERLGRTTSPKERDKTEKRITFLGTCITSAQRLSTTPPKEPTVFEILSKRTRRRKPSNDSSETSK